MRIWTAVLFLSLLAGPATAKLSKEQKEWMAKRDVQPLNFAIPESEASAAWAGAKAWIARFGELPIQIADETVIQTQVGISDVDARVQLTVTRSQAPSGEWMFHVSGRLTNIFSGGNLRRSMQAFAYYVASGIPYPDNPPKK